VFGGNYRSVDMMRLVVVCGAIFTGLLFLSVAAGGNLDAEPKLTLEKAVMIETFPRGSVARICAVRGVGVKEVTVQLMLVRAGKTEIEWTSTHRSATTANPSGQLVLLVEPGVHEHQYIPSIGCELEGYSSEGKSPDARPQAVITGAESRLRKVFQDTSPVAGKPVVLFAEACGSKEDVRGIARFKVSSAEEVVEASKKHKRVTFLVVTLSWSAMARK
jgi:hypothetical protein